MRLRPRYSLALLCVSAISTASICRAQPAPAAGDAGEPGADTAEEMPEEPSKPARPHEPSAPSQPTSSTHDADDAEPSDAEMEAEMAEAEGPSPSRPPAKGKGVIWGVVSEKTDHEGIIEATVSVVGTKYKALSDINGRYRLELPPGNYRLRYFSELHVPLRFEDIKVTEGKVVQLDAEMSMQEDAIDTVEVESEITRSTIEGEILTRQRAAAAGDSVGRVEIAKTPDRNAAQAAQRVVGATIVGGRFVYVRGLGERYTNAQLNGAPLPSPEPDRAAIPLDLFPTLVLDSITIAKTFTPDAPGDFAGGSVRIETREIPSKFLFQVSATAGFNTQSTFRDRLAYNSSSTDWLGFDDGTRALPYDFPKTKLDRNADPELTDRSGRAINSFFHTRRRSTPPDQGLSVVAGNGWTFKEGQKLGVLAAVNYGRAYSMRDDEISNEFTIAPGNKLLPSRSYRVQRGQDSVSWGGFGSVSYRFNDNHKLTLLGLHTQLSDNTVQIADGSTATTAGEVHDTRLSFVARNLDFGQLQGEHRFKSLASGTLDWTGWLSSARRSEPDSRAVVFRKAAAAQVWGLQDDDNSGRHFWADQSELGVGGKADWTQPLANPDSKLQLGALISQRSRDFDSRTMAFRPSPELSLRDRSAALSCPDTDFDACADNLFVNPNIGPVVRLFETTKPEDAYKAKLGVYAGYVMADLILAKPLRVVVGERIEVTRQTIDPFDQFDPKAHQQGGKVDSTDLLPSVSMIVETSKRTKLRAALTRTLARPQLRELAPFAYQDYFGGRFTSGNPNLKLTHITNVDLRYEFFPTVREVLAVSGFYKDLVDPIETVTQPTGDRGLVTFANAPGAKLYGVELEARKSLEFLTAALKDFSTITNLTLAKSRIDFSGGDRGNLTNADRPLVNQAPYVLNIALDYSNAAHGTIVRALYNLVGPRIVQVGSEGLPDAYVQARHLLDLTISQDLTSHFQVKLAARNLFFAKTLVTQGKRQENGNIVSRYSEPALIALTGSYTY